MQAIRQPDVKHQSKKANKSKPAGRIPGIFIPQTNLDESKEVLESESIVPVLDVNITSDNNPVTGNDDELLKKENESIERLKKLSVQTNFKSTNSISDEIENTQNYPSVEEPLGVALKTEMDAYTGVEDILNSEIRSNLQSPTKVDAEMINRYFSAAPVHTAEIASEAMKSQKEILSEECVGLETNESSKVNFVPIIVLAQPTKEVISKEKMLIDRLVDIQEHELTSQCLISESVQTKSIPESERHSIMISMLFENSELRLDIKPNRDIRNEDPIYNEPFHARLRRYIYSRSVKGDQGMSFDFEEIEKSILQNCRFSFEKNENYGVNKNDLIDEEDFRMLIERRPIYRPDLDFAIQNSFKNIFGISATLEMNMDLARHDIRSYINALRFRSNLAALDLHLGSRARRESFRNLIDKYNAEIFDVNDDAKNAHPEIHAHTSKSMSSHLSFDSCFSPSDTYSLFTCEMFSTSLTKPFFSNKSNSTRELIKQSLPKPNLNCKRSCKLPKYSFDEETVYENAFGDSMLVRIQEMSSALDDLELFLQTDHKFISNNVSGKHEKVISSSLESFISSWNFCLTKDELDSRISLPKENTSEVSECMLKNLLIECRMQDCILNDIVSKLPPQWIQDDEARLRMLNGGSTFFDTQSGGSFPDAYLNTSEAEWRIHYLHSTMTTSSNENEESTSSATPLATKKNTKMTSRQLGGSSLFFDALQGAVKSCLRDFIFLTWKDPFTRLADGLPVIAVTLAKMIHRFGTLKDHFRLCLYAVRCRNAASLWSRQLIVMPDAQFMWNKDLVTHALLLAATILRPTVVDLSSFMKFQEAIHTQKCYPLSSSGANQPPITSVEGDIDWEAIDLVDATSMNSGKTREFALSGHDIVVLLRQVHLPIMMERLLSDLCFTVSKIIKKSSKSRNDSNRIADRDRLTVSEVVFAIRNLSSVFYSAVHRLSSLDNMIEPASSVAHLHLTFAQRIVDVAGCLCGELSSFSAVSHELSDYEAASLATEMIVTLKKLRDFLIVRSAAIIHSFMNESSNAAPHQTPTKTPNDTSNNFSLILASRSKLTQYDMFESLVNKFFKSGLLGSATYEGLWAVVLVLCNYTQLSSISPSPTPPPQQKQQQQRHAASTYPQPEAPPASIYSSSRLDELLDSLARGNIPSEFDLLCLQQQKEQPNSVPSASPSQVDPNWAGIHGGGVDLMASLIQTLVKKSDAAGFDLGVLFAVIGVLNSRQQLDYQSSNYGARSASKVLVRVLAIGLLRAIQQLEPSCVSALTSWRQVLHASFAASLSSAKLLRLPLPSLLFQNDSLASLLLPHSDPCYLSSTSPSSYASPLTLLFPSFSLSKGRNLDLLSMRSLWALSLSLSALECLCHFEPSLHALVITSAAQVRPSAPLAHFNPALIGYAGGLLGFLADQLSFSVWSPALAGVLPSIAHALLEVDDPRLSAPSLAQAVAESAQRPFGTCLSTELSSWSPSYHHIAAPTTPETPFYSTDYSSEVIHSHLIVPTADPPQPPALSLLAMNHLTQIKKIYIKMMISALPVSSAVAPTLNTPFNSPVPNNASTAANWHGRGGVANGNVCPSQLFAWPSSIRTTSLRILVLHSSLMALIAPSSLINSPRSPPINFEILPIEVDRNVNHLSAMAAELVARLLELPLFADGASSLLNDGYGSIYYKEDPVNDYWQYSASTAIDISGTLLSALSRVASMYLLHHQLFPRNNSTSKGIFSSLFSSSPSRKQFLSADPPLPSHNSRNHAAPETPPTLDMEQIVPNIARITQSLFQQIVAVGSPSASNILKSFSYNFALHPHSLLRGLRLVESVHTVKIPLLPFAKCVSSHSKVNTSLVVPLLLPMSAEMMICQVILMHRWAVLFLSLYSTRCLHSEAVFVNRNKTQSLISALINSCLLYSRADFFHYTDCHRRLDTAYTQMKNVDRPFIAEKISYNKSWSTISHHRVFVEMLIPAIIRGLAAGAVLSDFQPSTIGEAARRVAMRAVVEESSGWDGKADEGDLFVMKISTSNYYLSKWKMNCALPYKSLPVHLGVCVSVVMGEILNFIEKMGMSSEEMHRKLVSLNNNFDSSLSAAATGATMHPMPFGCIPQDVKYSDFQHPVVAFLDSFLMLETATCLELDVKKYFVMDRLRSREPRHRINPTAFHLALEGLLIPPAISQCTPSFSTGGATPSAAVDAPMSAQAPQFLDMLKGSSTAHLICLRRLLHFVSLKFRAKDFANFITPSTLSASSTQMQNVKGSRESLYSVSKETTIALPWLSLVILYSSYNVNPDKDAGSILKYLSVVRRDASTFAPALTLFAAAFARPITQGNRLVCSPNFTNTDGKIAVDEWIKKLEADFNSEDGFFPQNIKKFFEMFLEPLDYQMHSHVRSQHFKKIYASANHHAASASNQRLTLFSVNPHPSITSPPDDFLENFHSVYAANTTVSPNISGFMRDSISDCGEFACNLSVIRILESWVVTLLKHVRNPEPLSVLQQIFSAFRIHVSSECDRSASRCSGAMALALKTLDALWQLNSSSSSIRVPSDPYTSINANSWIDSLISFTPFNLKLPVTTDSYRLLTAPGLSLYYSQVASRYRIEMNRSHRWNSLREQYLKKNLENFAFSNFIKKISKLTENACRSPEYLEVISAPHIIFSRLDNAYAVKVYYKNLVENPFALISSQEKSISKTYPHIVNLKNLVGMTTLNQDLCASLIVYLLEQFKTTIHEIIYLCCICCGLPLISDDTVPINSSRQNIDVLFHSLLTTFKSSIACAEYNIDVSSFNMSSPPNQLIIFQLVNNPDFAATIDKFLTDILYQNKPTFKKPNVSKNESIFESIEIASRLITSLTILLQRSLPFLILSCAPNSGVETSITYRRQAEAIRNLEIARRKIDEIKATKFGPNLPTFGIPDDLRTNASNKQIKKMNNKNTNAFDSSTPLNPYTPKIEFGRQSNPWQDQQFNPISSQISGPVPKNIVEARVNLPSHVEGLEMKSLVDWVPRLTSNFHNQNVLVEFIDALINQILSVVMNH